MSDSRLAIAEHSFFESVDSWDKALSLGVSCYSQIQRILVEDSLDGEDSYIGNMKVTTGLQRSLEELNERFPSLIEHIHSVELLIDGNRIIRC